MPFSVAAKNIMLDALLITEVSLHTGDPGPDGLLNECNGGSPAYARKAITHAAADNANRDSSDVPQFDIFQQSAIYVGYWAGTAFMGSKILATPETYAGQGVYDLQDSDLTLTDPVV